MWIDDADVVIVVVAGGGGGSIGFVVNSFGQFRRFAGTHLVHF